jgi:hypothetical protein
MQYTFDEIEIRTPGMPSGACGRLDPVTVEWDTSAASWPHILGMGISAIKVHSTQWTRNRVTGEHSVVTMLVDIMGTSTIEADFIVDMIAREIARREREDEVWMQGMYDQWLAGRMARTDRSRRRFSYALELERMGR